MLVPLIIVTPVLDETAAEMISEPGAQTSTQLPKLLKLDFASVLVVEPTVTAFAADAGE